MTHPHDMWAEGYTVMDMFTDAEDLVSQEWSGTEVGGGGPGMAADAQCSAAGGSPGGGAPCVAPRAPPPPGPAALSGSPQPASRATPPTSSSHFLHQQHQQQAGRGGPSPFSADLYASNHQLPSVETLMPGCVPGMSQPQQAHSQQSQQQPHPHQQHPQQQLHPQHQPHPQQQPHPQHQQNTYQNLGGYQGPVDDRQCGYPAPPSSASSSSLGYYPAEYAPCRPSTSPSATSPSGCHVIVPNPSRIKSEYFDQGQHQQCDPSWDGLDYAGASGRCGPPGPPPGPLVGVVKPDPDRTPPPPGLLPPAGRPVTGGVAAPPDLHAPGTSGTPPARKHPRQGYRRSTDGDPRKEKRREQNRRAALKCRIKKKGEWQILHENFAHLERHNAELQQKISTLREEKKKLREVLKSHQESCSLQVDLPPPSP